VERGEGEEEGEGKQRKSTHCFINLFFLTFVNLNIKDNFLLRRIKGKAIKYCGREDGNLLNVHVSFSRAISKMKYTVYSPPQQFETDVQLKQQGNLYYIR